MTWRYFRVPFMPFVAAAAVAVAGCSGAGAHTAAASVEKRDLTVGAVPAADTAGLYVAQTQGLFAAEGLHIKIVPVTSGATAIADQMAGRYDVTLGNYVSYILADALQHADLRILAEASVMQPHSQEVLTLPTSHIRAIADLKGKRIGVNVLNNIGTVLVSSVLVDHAMTPSEVHFVPVPFPEMAAALAAHRVDAAWVPEPFVSSIQMSLGALELCDLDQGSTQSLPVGGYIVTQSWLAKYPKTAAAFVRAIVKGQAIADGNRALVEQAMMKYTGVSHVIASIMAIDSYPLSVDPVRIQRIADAMLKFGLLKQRFNVASIIR